MTRTINPGHCIETSWFIMEEAKLRGWDRPMFDLALQVFDWSWDWGWDKQYGGIINFRDCKNLPSQDYSQDMKFWWPQCETIIASLYASASGHTPTSPMPSTASGTAICIATEQWHSRLRATSTRVRSTFRV